MTEKALIPYSDIEKMAMVMGKGKLFGKTADELLPLMLIAQAEGLHPVRAAQDYDIIQGKPAITSRAALSRFQEAGGKINWIVRNDKEAEAEFSHPQGGNLKVKWTMERAVQAGVAGKATWKQYPAQMLSARVVAEGVRAVYPACLSRLYTVEEVVDFSSAPFGVVATQREDGSIVIDANVAPSTTNASVDKTGDDPFIYNTGRHVPDNYWVLKKDKQYAAMRAMIGGDHFKVKKEGKDWLIFSDMPPEELPEVN